MSFDGVLLHKLLPEFYCLKSGRITKIIESGDTDFVFIIRANHQNYSLMLSLSSDFARIHLTNKAYEAPQNPKSFTMFLRKHLEGYFISDILQYGNDRILYFKLTGYNEMRDFTTKYLICEIMGRYSNLILTDESFKILELLKKGGISEFHRTLLINATYEFPKQEKLNPFSLSLIELQKLNISSPKELCKTLEGVSMSLASYVFQQENYIQNFYNILHQESIPSIFRTANQKLDYSYIPLEEPVEHSYASISALLDSFYFEMDQQAKIKQKTNDLASFVQKQIVKNQKKIEKLTKELQETDQAEEYKMKGELLLSYPNLKAKESFVDVFNYYTNELISISLDSRYDVITNSQKFFKKYQKAKTAKHYMQEQIEHAQNEIAYFEILLNQLKSCTLHDALEIRQELEENRYLLKASSSLKKKAKPNFLTYLVEDTLIHVGKNNLQNEYITHKLAKPSEYWFHVKDSSGSHVVVHTQDLTETLIRSAAMLAACYSPLKASSSVAVDYTQIKNIKKIPGKRSCFVTYTKQKTIYIDPDEKIIESMKIKK